MPNIATPRPPQRTQQVTPAAPLEFTDADLKKRQCFAIVKKLKRRFHLAGISENAFWCWSLGTQGLEVIGSRSQFEERNWTLLAARLDAAEKHPQLFEALCKQIKQQGNCRVYRINPDLSEIKVYDDVFEKSVYERSQRHADRTGCTVRLHAFGECESFEPAEMQHDPNTPPITDTA